METKTVTNYLRPVRVSKSKVYPCVPAINECDNGHFRDVCGWCVKQFKDGGSSARLVERIEKLNKSKYGQR